MTDTLSSTLDPALTGNLTELTDRERGEAKAFARHNARPYSAGRLRRSTLVALRWGAVAGQILAMAVVYFGLGFTFPVGPALLIIGLSALLNLLIQYLAPLDRRVKDNEALAHLGFDILQLAALLWLTGGMENPFALLFIAPVVTSATTLSRRVLFGLVTLTVLLSLLLMRYSQPLPWYPGESFTLPDIFKFGTWVALMTGMAFTSLYAWRTALESRRMSDALAATEAVLAQEQKLSALGGLAAAAAHELGTPLATIQVTAKEMARELDADTDLGADARLMHSQAKRCRDILQQLGRRGDEGDMIHDVFSLKALLDEVAEPFLGFGAKLEISVAGPSPDAPMPELRRQAELVYGLTNILENAIDFASETVTMTGRWDMESIYIDVLDDGPGFDPSVKSRLGEPYVSSRADKSGAGGLGLGFFIAKTLLERTGAHVDFGNRKSTSGAFVRASWPKHRIAANKQTSYAE